MTVGFTIITFVSFAFDVFTLSNITVPCVCLFS